MAFSFEYPTPLPSTKGWGPGWSATNTTCSVVRPHIKPHPLFAGGTHEDITELVNLLVEEMQRRKFKFLVPGCWGFACRGTKSSAGSTGGTPSFHSWGLALDINAPENVYGAPASSSDIATNNRWVVTLLRQYGFFWLGPSIGDWMHFSFCGSPADAKKMTAKARRKFRPKFVVAGKVFKKIGKALKSARNLLEKGKNKVVVKRQK